MRWCYENLRFLLWQSRLPQSKWFDQLTTWLKGDVERAAALLQGVEPNDQERLLLAELADLRDTDLGLVRLLERSDVNLLRENLHYLLDNLPHGGKKEVAVHLGVRPLTISRWLKGEQQPTRNHLRGLCGYFNLPYATDLERDPLFLELLPISAQDQRKWLHRWLDELDTATLGRLFWALYLMLSSAKASETVQRAKNH
jgi:transcriptional regulator with XRE-family HTH domain